MRNLKKVIALVAVFAMLVSTVAFAQTFTDVTEDHDYYEAIEMLSSLQILTGDDQDGDGKLDFRPEDTITRAEVAAIISRIQNITSAAQTDTEFVDVPASHWASGYVAQAAGQGIVNGYGDGNFGPEDPVLYEQAVKMLIETLGYAPFVADNGGYPTGHLTAASRYGVLEGVKGGAIGAQATRGMVAQMVYNAIDTPLMDRFTYGAEAEYVIYNGKNENDYVTLLSRDLGVKKFTGVITANQVTDFTGAVDIDTEEDVVIDVTFDDTDDYYNYECDEIDTIYEADCNACDLIGYHVEMYVRESGRNGNYEIVSVAATNKNKTAEFTLDQYDTVAGGYVEYFKNESDRTTTKLKLGKEVAVFYNNIYEGTDAKLAGLLDDQTYSGKVTLVDNDSTSGYDVVFVEIGAVAVVDEVSANGKINFKNAPKNSEGDKIALKFDEDETDTIIELTKGGEAVDYTELTEWDVLSVLYNAAAEYYVAEVVESGKVEGSITGSTASDTSAYDKKKFTINGTQYDVANGWYDNGKMAVGSAGVFYIDNYGKIVAYDKNGAATASDKYGFILAVSDVIPSDFGDTDNVRVLILDKSGEIYEAELASTMKIVNRPGDYGTFSANDSIKLENMDVEAFAEDLEGQLVTYAANSAGELKEVVFSQSTDEEDGTLFLDKQGKASYDEEDFELTFTKGGKFDITDETIIFYINAGGAAALGEAADKVTSKVGTVAGLATQENVDAVVYDTDNDVPSVLVLFNTTGGISPASNAAVIDEIGSAYVDGEDVVSVTYYFQGEKLSATTNPELDAADDLALATQGDIWKLAVVDGIITDAEEVISVDAEGRKTNKPGEAGALALEFPTTDTNRNDTWFFGPAVEYRSSNKTIKIAGVDKDGDYDFYNTVNIKAGDAFVYVYDPMKKNNKLIDGDASDVYAEQDVVEAKYGITVDDGKDAVAAGELPLGMLDFVAATAYDGDVLDVVIYKAYEFDYDIHEASDAE